MIEICKGIVSAASGAKRYKLLPIGQTTPLIVEETLLEDFTQEKVKPI